MLHVFWVDVTNVNKLFLVSLQLKRQAEAIEALESNLDKPKMTNIDNVKKPTKQKFNVSLYTIY